MRRQKILAVDDEIGMCTFYNYLFNDCYKDEFVGVVSDSVETALRVLRYEDFDAAVIDWVMPELSGLELLRAARADSRTKSVSILVVSALSAPQDVCSALESGADDHLSKPFDESVLVARLRSLARRRRLALEERGVYRFDGLLFDPAAERLTIDGREVRLHPKELDILRVFLERPNVIHSHAALWDSIWDTERDRWRDNLVCTIYNLRRKLGSKWGRRIETHKTKGFLFRR